MLTRCGPVITCRTGGIPEAAGEDCVYADVDSSDQTGAHQKCLEESLRRCLDKVVLEMTDEQREEMTSKARKYSMQFGRDHVFSLLESKAMLARDKNSVARANSPELKWTPTGRT